MRNNETILEAYKKSSTCERLNMYMHYPSLRRVFFLIDSSMESVTGRERIQNQGDTPKKVKVFQRTSPLQRFFRGLGRAGASP